MIEHISSLKPASLVHRNLITPRLWAAGMLTRLLGFASNRAQSKNPCRCRGFLIIKSFR
jgi:hypothetical protein